MAPSGTVLTRFDVYTFKSVLSDLKSFTETNTNTHIKGFKESDKEGVSHNKKAQWENITFLPTELK